MGCDLRFWVEHKTDSGWELSPLLQQKRERELTSTSYPEDMTFWDWSHRVERSYWAFAAFAGVRDEHLPVPPLLQPYGDIRFAPTVPYGSPLLKEVREDGDFHSIVWLRLDEFMALPWWTALNVRETGCPDETYYQVCLPIWAALYESGEMAHAPTETRLIFAFDN